MNATQSRQPQTEDLTKRHLRLCAELADLAMGLARGAAARTLADWAEPEQPSRNPSAEPPFTQPAEPQAEREAAPHANPAPRLAAGRPDRADLLRETTIRADEHLAVVARVKTRGPTIHTSRGLMSDASFAAASHHRKPPTKPPTKPPGWRQHPHGRVAATARPVAYVGENGTCKLTHTPAAAVNQPPPPLHAPAEDS